MSRLAWAAVFGVQGPAWGRLQVSAVSLYYEKRQPLDINKCCDVCRFFLLRFRRLWRRRCKARSAQDGWRVRRCGGDACLSLGWQALHVTALGTYLESLLLQQHAAGMLLTPTPRRAFAAVRSASSRCPVWSWESCCRFVAWVGYAYSHLPCLGTAEVGVGLDTLLCHCATVKAHDAPNNTL